MNATTGATALPLIGAGLFMLLWGAYTLLVVIEIAMTPLPAA